MQLVLSAPTPAAPPEPRLDIVPAELDPCTSVISLAGDLDLATAPALKASLGAWLDARTHGDLILELSGIHHIDSTGLAVLLAFRRRMPQDCRLALAAPSRHVVRLLALTGLDRAVEAHPSVEEASSQLRRTRGAGGADAKLPLTSDAAVAVGLAVTAFAFGTDGPVAEADRWARILLPSGGPDIAAGLLDAHEADFVEDGPAADAPHERIDRVVAWATTLAGERGGCAVRLDDIVAGVTAVYGPAFSRALRAQL